MTGREIIFVAAFSWLGADQEQSDHDTKHICLRSKLHFCDTPAFAPDRSPAFLSLFEISGIDSSVEEGLSTARKDTSST